MARLDELPDQATIMAMRGVVDFYVWKGIPVARRWPKKSLQPRTAGEIASSEVFVAMVKIPGASQSEVQDAYRTMMQGRGVTWIDLARATVSAANPWIRLG